MRIVDGKGYGPMPFYMAPLYPYVLAITYGIFGHSVPTVYVLQMILGLANIFMVYLLGERVFGHYAGLAAAILVTLYAPIMYMESKLLTETLSITLSLASLLALMYALDEPATWKFLGTGVLLGLSAICRPPTLIMAVFIIGWLMLRKRQKAFVGTLALGIVLAIMPVTIRNAVAGKSFVPLTTNGGIVFAQANHPLANGLSFPLPGFTHSIEVQQEQEIREAEKALGRKVTPTESSAYWFGYGMRFIEDQPGKFLSLLGKKFVWSLHSTEAACSYNVFFEKSLVGVLNYLMLPIWVFTGLGVFGFILAGRKGKPESELLALQVAAIFLNLWIFSVSGRYRAPAVPALAIFAGFGIVQAVGAIKKSNWSPAILGAICLLALFLPSLVKYPVPAMTAEAPANAGAACLLQGDPEAAAIYLRQALDLYPHFGYAHLKLGAALEKMGDISQAEYHYAQAVELEPENVEARYLLANALLNRGDNAEAVMHYEAALKVRPDVADIHSNLGVGLERVNRSREAIEHYRRAIELDRNCARYHYNLGNALDGQGRISEAIREYCEAIRLQPDLAVSHNNLACDYYAQGKYAEAWKEIYECRRYGHSPDADLLIAIAKKMPDPGRP